MFFPSSAPQLVCKYSSVDAAKRANVNTPVVESWIDAHESADCLIPWQQLLSDLKECVSETPEDVMERLQRSERQLGNYFSQLLKLPKRLSDFPSLRRQLKASGGIGPWLSWYGKPSRPTCSSQSTCTLQVKFAPRFRQTIPDLSVRAACCQERLRQYLLRVIH